MATSLFLASEGRWSPFLARLARRACDQAGVKDASWQWRRCSDRYLPAECRADGIETITCDLLDREALARLPEIPNVIFMAARKFGHRARNI